MHDRGWIIAGLLLFLGAATLPFWYNMPARPGPSAPEIKLPASGSECVAPVAYMKHSHMILLRQWRDDAVRRNIRTYRAYNGKSYDISLTGTCLQQCHKEKAQFCDRCHAYNGVQEPACWNCHVDPNGALVSTGGRDDVR
jgi:hypothetical protein